MTIDVRHKFASPKGDGSDASFVRPSNWNDNHDIKMTGPALIGRADGTQGPAAEIPIGEGLSVSGGNLHATAGGVPVGSVMQFAGATAPAKWLLCYGQSISRTTYSALYAAIGTAFGAGNGSTTFNLPDCRGRVGAGKDNMGGTAAGRLTHNTTDGVTGNTLGAVGGRQSHTITIEELPSHSHDGQALADGEHAHLLFSNVNKAVAAPVLNDTDPVSYKNDTGGNASYTLAPDVGGDATVGKSEDAGTHTHAVTTDLVGGNDQHNIMQPTIVFNTMIYAGV